MDVACSDCSRVCQNDWHGTQDAGAEKDAMCVCDGKNEFCEHGDRCPHLVDTTPLGDYDCDFQNTCRKCRAHLMHELDDGAAMEIVAAEEAMEARRAAAPSPSLFFPVHDSRVNGVACVRCSEGRGEGGGDGEPSGR